MRLDDARDYFRLRRHLAEPWRFLRLRGRERERPMHEIRLREGGAVKIRGDSMDRHILHRIFARDEYRLDRLPPREGLTVVDIGAHIGLFAVRAAGLGARVIACEPAPDNFRLLVENVQPFARVTPLRTAVGARRGIALLRLSDDASAHSLLPAGAQASERTAETACTTLGALFEAERVGRCDILKLDCEGAELEIVESAPRELWQAVDRVALEYHPRPERNASGPAALARLLEEGGHQVEVIPSRKDASRGRLFSRRVSAR